MKHNAIYTFELFGGTIKDSLSSLKAGALLNIPLYLQSSTSELDRDIEKDVPDYASKSVFEDGTVSSIRGPSDNPLNLFNMGIALSFALENQITKLGVTNVLVERNGVGHNIVKWTVSGPKSHLDHFIIYSKINNKTSIAGVQCSIPSRSSNVFYDTRCVGAIGTASYTIVAVDLDFKIVSTSTPSRTINMV